MEEDPALSPARYAVRFTPSSTIIFLRCHIYLMKTNQNTRKNGNEGRCHGKVNRGQVAPLRAAKVQGRPLCRPIVCDVSLRRFSRRHFAVQHSSIWPSLRSSFGFYVVFATTKTLCHKMCFLISSDPRHQFSRSSSEKRLRVILTQAPVVQNLAIEARVIDSVRSPIVFYISTSHLRRD